jgi:hypothetical protein
MLKSIKSIMLSLVFLFLAFSCSQENEVSPTNNELELSVLISDHLNSVAKGLRENKQTFANEKLVSTLGKQHLEGIYGVNSDAVNRYSESLDNVGYQNGRTTNAQDNLSDEAKQYLILMQESVNSSEHLQAYKEKLAEIDQSIISSNISEEDKTILRAEIISLDVSLTFTAYNFDLFHPEANLNGRTSGEGDECEEANEETETPCVEMGPTNVVDPSWWSSWGKCAASIVSGAGTSALTFGLAGAAVGTVTIPIIGTVSAGAVGAISGAIFGGLGGAVAGC